MNNTEYVNKKYKVFDSTDLKELIDSPVIRICDDKQFNVQEAESNKVTLADDNNKYITVSAKELLSDFKFIDNTPCGTFVSQYI